MSTQASETIDTSRASSEQNESTDFAESCYKVLSADYEEIEHIGSGSFGEVVKAKHRATGKEVAIKIIQNIGNTDYHRR